VVGVKSEPELARVNVTVPATALLKPTVRVVVWAAPLLAKAAVLSAVVAQSMAGVPVLVLVVVVVSSFLQAETAKSSEAARSIFLMRTGTRIKKDAATHRPYQLGSQKSPAKARQPTRFDQCQKAIDA
jgi:uncharacterized membrane protein YbhN (UPF0104 family)